MIVVDTGEIVALLDADAKHHEAVLEIFDAVVMVQAERLEAHAVVTLDMRHFRGVKLQGNPKLLPLGG
jgi:predicted nucleic acid-binding protein